MGGQVKGPSRRFWIGWIAVLAVGYVVSSQVLHKRTTPARDISNSAIPMSSGQVPTNVQDDILARLGNVVQPDEVAFFPLVGNRVGVYATIDLGYASPNVTTADLNTIDTDINRWFTDVYGAQGGYVVADAEIFFLKNGRTVGGAGLGINAYRSLAAKTASFGDGSNLVQSIAQGPVVSGESTQEEWYEVNA